MRHEDGIQGVVATITIRVDHVPEERIDLDVASRLFTEFTHCAIRRCLVGVTEAARKIPEIALWLDRAPAKEDRAIWSGHDHRCTWFGIVKIRLAASSTILMVVDQRTKPSPTVTAVQA